MMEPWIAVLVAGGVVLATDLSTTLLRKRARRKLTSPRPLPQAEPEGVQDEGVARDQN